MAKLFPVVALPLATEPPSVLRALIAFFENPYKESNIAAAKKYLLENCNPTGRVKIKCYLCDSNVKNSLGHDRTNILLATLDSIADDGSSRSIGQQPFL